MSFPLVLRSSYNSLQKDYENMRWSLEKQLEQMEEGMRKLLQSGEDYRAGLAGENDRLISENSRLTALNGNLQADNQTLQVKLTAAQSRIRELEMLKASIEARWVSRMEDEDGKRS